jgi:exocyst complex component 1
LSLFADVTFQDFTESLIQTLESSSTASSNPSSLASKPAFAPSAFKKLCSQNDARELRRGIDALRKRVEKHFGDPLGQEEQEVTRNLMAKVLGRCEEKFAAEVEKMATVPKQVYGQLMDEGHVPANGLGMGKEDIARWFRGLK